MRNIRKIAVGSLVGLALTLGINTVALAAPAATSTTGTSTTGTAPAGAPSTGTSSPAAKAQVLTVSPCLSLSPRRRSASRGTRARR